jgi:O-phosphoseryl-tRNA(Cys) synthetase
MAVPNRDKQNITVSLDGKVLRNARILAVKQGMSISGFLAKQIEAFVGEEDVYKAAQREAMALLDRGFHLGGVIKVTRYELHER